MATEKMYELAFQYKDTKLWQQIYDDEMFAVRLTDGEIGYCSVMGMMGDHLALGLYVGEEGYKSYRLLLDAEYALLDDVVMGALLREQSCLQCSFENKSSLSEEELAELHQYATAHEKVLRGKDAFPQFTKYRPGRYPWFFDSPLDKQRICDALTAAIALARLLRRCSKEELGLHSLRNGIPVIPLLAFADGCWFVRYTELPAAEIAYPEPELVNEVAAAHIKRKVKKGIWECGTVRLPNAVLGEAQQGEAPYFPLTLVCVELGTGLVQQLIVTDGEDAAEMMNRFAEQILDVDIAPQKINCGDERCYAILKDLCAKTGIQLERTAALKTLRRVMRDLLEHTAEDENEEPDAEQLEIFELLMQMRDGDLTQLPQDVATLLLRLAEAGVLSEPMAKRVKMLAAQSEPVQ
ncbi:MAG: DUF6930 domain-containing protein [Candidatus Limivicinus sp.]